MKLRITGGIFRNISITLPLNKNIRPTTGVVRQSVFNICHDKIDKSTFLDIFAGTGVMGIEAISRGSSFVTFIDSDKTAVKNITHNLEKLDLSSQSQVMLSDSTKAIKRLNKRYDIVYIDAPYSLYVKKPTLVQGLLDALTCNCCLNAGAYVFVEEGAINAHHSKLQNDSFIHKSSRKFGSSLLHHYIYAKELDL